jgi:AcrR family transcriptional regulator
VTGSAIVPDGSRATRPRAGRLEEVRDAALSLFALHGDRATTMVDIARELGLGAPSLYNHIASKGEILREICASTMDALLARQQDALREPDAVGRLQAMTDAHVRFAATSRREVIVADRDFIHLAEPYRAEVLGLRKRYERGFRSVIEEGRTDGSFRVEEPKLASYAIIEMGTSVAAWFREHGPLPLETVTTEYGKYALRMVGFRA